MGVVGRSLDDAREASRTRLPKGEWLIGAIVVFGVVSSPVVALALVELS